MKSLKITPKASVLMRKLVKSRFDSRTQVKYRFYCKCCHKDYNVIYPLDVGRNTRKAKKIFRKSHAAACPSIIAYRLRNGYLPVTLSDWRPGAWNG